MSIEYTETDPLTVMSHPDNTYLVEVGHDFQVTCISTGNFSGEVNWYKFSNSNTSEWLQGVCVCVC